MAVTYLNESSTRLQRVTVQGSPACTPRYLCHSQCGWSSPRTPSGTQPLLVQHQPSAWESLLPPTFLLPERHERLSRVSADLSQTPGTSHTLLRRCCKVGAAEVHSYNGQSQHDRSEFSCCKSHLERWSNSEKELVLTLSQATHILQKKKASPSKHVNPVTH